MQKATCPIGVFDSGYGGLTILDHIRRQLPDYDYVYLGDNARTPYGTRSFEIVYQFTRQAVARLFEEGCPLVVLACNTASAKALRTIQQVDLPAAYPSYVRVLGVIRPTVEALAACTPTVADARRDGLSPAVVRSLIEVNKYPNVIARVQLKNQTGVNDGISSLRGTKQSILVIARATPEAIRKDRRLLRYARNDESAMYPRHIGILGTAGTISSGSYTLEIAKLYPDMIVSGEACPMWVPLVENREYDSDGADFFVKKNIDHLFAADPLIDTVVLACTHYPLLETKIRKYLPDGVTLISQGPFVADSLKDYLRRHPDMAARLSVNGTCRFLTTEAKEKFMETASLFLKRSVFVEQIMIR